jgi:hypothetical protein
MRRCIPLAALLLVAPLFTACTDTPTAAEPADEGLAVTTVEGLTAASGATAMARRERLRARATIDIEGRVTRINRRRGMARIRFQGTTENGTAIGGEGRMRFKGRAGPDGFLLERGQLRVNGFDGKGNDVRARAKLRFPKGAVIGGPEFNLEGVEALYTARLVGEASASPSGN